MDVRLSDVIAPAFYDVHRQIAAGNVGEALCKGGRGGAKSSFISVEILLLLLRWPTAHAVVLRKVGKTLRNSVYNQMRWAIGALGMEAYFRCLLSPMEILCPRGRRSSSLALTTRTSSKASR